MRREGKNLKSVQHFAFVAVDTGWQDPDDLVLGQRLAEVLACLLCQGSRCVGTDIDLAEGQSDLGSVRDESARIFDKLEGDEVQVFELGEERRLGIELRIPFVRHERLGVVSEVSIEDRIDGAQREVYDAGDRCDETRELVEVSSAIRLDATDVQMAQTFEVASGQSLEEPASISAVQVQQLEFDDIGEREQEQEEGCVCQVKPSKDQPTEGGHDSRNHLAEAFRVRRASTV